MNIVFKQNEILIEIRENQFYFPSEYSLKFIEQNLQPITFKSINSSISNKNNYFLANFIGELPENASNLSFISYRQAFTYFNLEILKELAYLWQFYNYYSTHKFCGKCGTKTKPGSNNNNIFLYCSSCREEVYPHIAPCIIVLIYKEEQVLMARNKNFPPQLWSLIAGFVEIGETLEQAVIREVKEEVNIEVENIEYWGSQAWPFPTGSLMVGFTAKYQSGTIRVDGEEISEAGFFNINNLPGRPTKFSIAHKMLEDFASKKL
jgi:NAD+ diphosphatase